MLNAKTILHTRELRRKLASRILFVLVALFALGVFVISEWLDNDPVRFAIFWGGIFILTIVVAMLAIYDGLRVAGEVKSEHNKEMAQQLRDIAQLLKDEQEKQKKEQKDSE